MCAWFSGSADRLTIPWSRVRTPLRLGKNGHSRREGWITDRVSAPAEAWHNTYWASSAWVMRCQLKGAYGRMVVEQTRMSSALAGQNKWHWHFPEDILWPNRAGFEQGVTAWCAATPSGKPRGPRTQAKCDDDDDDDDIHIYIYPKLKYRRDWTMRANSA